VGETRQWPALDDVEGVYYLKEYRLAAVGDHTEVWVAVGENASYDTPQAPPGGLRRDRGRRGPHGDADRQRP